MGKKEVLVAIVLIWVVLFVAVIFHQKATHLEERVESLHRELADRQEFLELNKVLLDEVMKLRRENEEMRIQLRKWLEQWEVETFEVTAYTLAGEEARKEAFRWGRREAIIIKERS